MKSSFKYFRSSFFVLIAGVIAAFFLGKLQAVFITLILAVLEISLSFDNAIVNAKVLKDMEEVWRRRFLTWGMIIAVFGMRLVFPVLIVSIVAGFSPWAAFSLALSEPEKYAHALESAHVIISGFGGGFLLMVFLKFFFDMDKDIHWIEVIEKRLVKFAKIESVEIIFSLIITLIISKFVHHEDSNSFLIAGVLGIIGFLMVKGIEGLLEGTNHNVTTEVVRSGLATFLYLEILDASFSFDGVIGAFALSKDIYIIMIGLGIGAMFVRSLTLYFVGQGTLSKFIYLEHGAFWAIGALAIIMYISTVRNVPEVITGLIGGVLILSALYSSILFNKSDKLKKN
jgi:hypothetical protein